MAPPASDSSPDSSPVVGVGGDEAPPQVRLFVYGLLLQGEREHALLGGAPLLGAAQTAPEYTLVDLDFYPVLLVDGHVSVVGELYGVSRHQRFKLDVHHQCPVLFRRIKVK